MINLGIVGCGKIAEHHIKVISKIRGITVSGISDLNFDKALIVGKKYGIPSFQNYNKMLSSIQSINLVAIITPSGMHFTHAMDIIKNFKKNLIIEKPFLLKQSQVKKLYKLAKQKKCKIFPIFQHRYNRAVQRVFKSINSGELGKVLITNVRLRWCRPDRYYRLSKWRGTFSQDGGALSNQGIHLLDLLTYLGGEISNLNVIMKTFGAKIEVEDTLVATLEHKNGGVGTLEVTTAARPDDFEASISIIGSKGLAQIGGKALNELQTFSPKKIDCKKYSENFPDTYGFGHSRIYLDIVRSLKSNKNFTINEKESFRTTKLLNAFYKADELRKTVNINKISESKRLGKKNKKLYNLYST